MQVEGKTGSATRSSIGLGNKRHKLYSAGTSSRRGSPSIERKKPKVHGEPKKPDKSKEPKGDEQQVNEHVENGELPELDPPKKAVSVAERLEVVKTEEAELLGEFEAIHKKCEKVRLE